MFSAMLTTHRDQAAYSEALYLHAMDLVAHLVGIAVMLSVIGKLSRSEIGPLVFPVRQGNIGADAGVFNGFDVLDGAIFRVASHLARMQLPTEAHAPQQVAHRVVIHDLRRRH